MEACAFRLHNLPARLRRRFRLAWAMVPSDARANLPPVLHVRGCEFDIEFDIPGLYGVYHVKRRIVYLHPCLARGPRALAVAVILHELAHAADPLARQRRLKDR